MKKGEIKVNKGVLDKKTEVDKGLDRALKQHSALKKDLIRKPRKVYLPKK